MNWYYLYLDGGLLIKLIYIIVIKLLGSGHGSHSFVSLWYLHTLLYCVCLTGCITRVHLTFQVIDYGKAK